VLRRLSARLPVLAALVSAAFSLTFVLRASFVIDGQRYFTLFDDAMVSMQYARTFAEGHGLVWNADGPPVEGYTNFLWTMWMAVVHLAGVSDRLASLVVSLSGAVIVAATAIVSARLTRRLIADADPPAEAIAAFAVGLCYPLLFWTLRGMEVGLLALLLVLAVTEALPAADGSLRIARLSFLLALLTLVRPDAVMPALAIAVSAVAASSLRIRRRLLICAVPIAVLLLDTAFRWLYYGSPLPNTYYLKMSGIPLAVRFARGTLAVRGALLYIGLPFAIAALNRRMYRHAASALVITVPLLLVAYTLYVGGDAWEWMPYTNRYVTPALPLLFAGAAATMARLDREGFSRAIFGGALEGLAEAVALLALIAVVSGPGYLDWVRTRGAHVVDDANKVWMGVRIRQTTGPSTRIAVVWAGAVPYFAHRPAIDFLGKSDPVIAHHPPVTEFFPGHDRFDYGYSIGTLRPDLIVQLWFPSDALFAQLPKWGYAQVYGGVFAKRGAEVDVERLRAAFDEPPIR
jgi:hypothetical protein